MHKNLGDKKKTQELYKKAESKAEVISDFCSLAESVHKNFNDNKWASSLYFKAEKKARDSNDFCSLADSLCENLRDKKWAKEIYNKAEKKLSVVSLITQKCKKQNILICYLPKIRKYLWMK